MSAVAGDGAFDFGGLSSEAQDENWLNGIKAVAKKRFGKYYPAAVAALGPVYGPPFTQNFLRDMDLDRSIVCNLGSGTSVYDERIVCVDGYRYENVHVVVNLEQLPFPDNSISAIISEAVLEHVSDPERHVAEMHRVLAPGGRVLCFFPFLQGFHASPHDYSRRTMPGMRRLFSDFEIVSLAVGGGPTSALIWVLQEWLAIAGSFGNERLYRLLVPMTWALSPIKYLDRVLIHHPAAHVIASGYTLEARKRS